MALNCCPYWIMFVGAHFVVYALVAWLVVVSRLSLRRFSRLEWLVFAVFCVAVALEWFQLFADGFMFGGRNTYGLPRYFGVFAPLLWLWVAKVLSDLWALPRQKSLRFCVRAGIVGALGWLAFSLYWGEVHDFYQVSAVHDVKVAAERVAKVIEKDYRGPRRQEKGNRALHEYFSTRRPVVFSDMSAAAWLVRGQSEGANLRGCPYLDDYLFIRLGSGYRDIETVDARQYDYVGDVQGDGTQWRLFRRKGVPHGK